MILLVKSTESSERTARDAVFFVNKKYQVQLNLGRNTENVSKKNNS